MLNRAALAGQRTGDLTPDGRLPARATEPGRPNAGRIRVAVAVADEAIERIDEVAARCQAVGFRRDVTLAGIGVFTGSVELRWLAVLTSIPGVLAVAARRTTSERWPAACH